jgi:hypothetical protein
MSGSSSRAQALSGGDEERPDSVTFEAAPMRARSRVSSDSLSAHAIRPVPRKFTSSYGGTLPLPDPVKC